LSCSIWIESDQPIVANDKLVLSDTEEVEWEWDILGRILKHVIMIIAYLSVTVGNAVEVEARHRRVVWYLCDRIGAVEELYGNDGFGREGYFLLRSRNDGVPSQLAVLGGRYMVVFLLDEHLWAG